MARRPLLATVFQTVALTLAASMFVFSVWIVLTAFLVPLELEIREGTEWIHILAKKAGVDIYDGGRVAFVNMNHGPMDSILKGWISRAMPFLPGAMVLRIFVLLTPFFLLGAAYEITRRNWTYALLAAAVFQLFQMNLTGMVLVGRSDATALCGLAVCGVFVHRLSQVWRGRPFGWRPVLDQILLGIFSAVVFLACWRNVLILADLFLIACAGRWSACQGARLKALLLAPVLFLGGFALVWVPTFLFELHGDLALYHKRFFGFFSAASGWGTFSRGPFLFFPAVVLHGRFAILCLMLGLVLLAAYRLRRRPVELTVWLVMLVALWVALDYVYYKNAGGGGVHYFLPFFFLAWLFILHALPDSRSGRGRARDLWVALRVHLVAWWGRPWPLPLVHDRGPVRQIVLIGLVAAVLPWRSLWDQGRNLTHVRRDSLTFLRDVKVRVDGEAIFSEDSHLFKHKYRGEVVDTGDTVSVIASTGYYGRAFTRTYQAYVERLQAEPPRFVLAGLLNPETQQGVLSPELSSLLRSQYDIVLRLPGVLDANGGCEIVLFERRR